MSVIIKINMEIMSGGNFVVKLLPKTKILMIVKKGVLPRFKIFRCATCH